MERKLPTTLMRMLDVTTQRAVSQYYECLLYDWRHQGDEVSRHRAWLILGGRALSVPDRFWTNVCVVCERRGSIVPHHRQGPSIPIEALCKQCGRHVCHDCLLKVPGSMPLRFREDPTATPVASEGSGDPGFCSRECWLAAGSPKEDEELGLDGAA